MRPLRLVLRLQQAPPVAASPWARRVLQILDEALLIVQLGDLLLVLGNLTLNVLEVALANSAACAELGVAHASSLA